MQQGVPVDEGFFLTGRGWPAIAPPRPAGTPWSLSAPQTAGGKGAQDRRRGGAQGAGARNPDQSAREKIEANPPANFPAFSP